MRRKEVRTTGTNTGLGPNELFYRFAGKQMGMVGNNGTVDTGYVQSVADRSRATPDPTASTAGIFRDGTNQWTVARGYADFSQSIDPYNSGQQGSAGGGTYTVRSGDTLQGIAAALYGDGNLWYRIAEANGLSAGAALSEGQSLMLPAGVTKNTHNAGTFQPYDAAEAMGDTLPTTPKPPKTPKCGAFGAIIMVAIAVAVTALTAGTGGPLAGSAVASALGVSSTAGAVIGGAAAAALGSAVSQGFGVATGIQDKFSFKQVALAGVSSLAGSAAGGLVKLGTAVAASGFAKVAGDVVRGALSSALSQGVSVAAGLQKSFSWTNVATAGIGAGVAGAASRSVGGQAHIDADGNRVDASFGNMAAGTMADTIAQAATRSAIKGNSFGDNLLASLPSALGNLAGRALAAGVGTAFDGKGGYIFQPEYPEGEATPKADFAVNTAPQTPLRKVDPDEVLGVTRVTSGGGDSSTIVTGRKTAMTPAERRAYNRQIAREEAGYRRPSSNYSPASIKQRGASSAQRGFGVNTETGETFGIGGGTLTYENYAYSLLNTDKNLGRLDGSVKYYTQESGLEALLDRLETDITTRLKSADSSFEKLTDDVGVYSLSLGEKDYSNATFNGLVNLRDSIDIALKDKSEKFQYAKLLSDGLSSRIDEINPTFRMASGQAEEVGGVFQDTLMIGGAGPAGRYVGELVERVGAKVAEKLAARAAARAAAERVTARAASTDLVPFATKTLGDWGEVRLSSLLGGQGVKPAKPFLTPTGPRYADRLLDGIAYESKAGLNVKLTSGIERQIAKDAWLINNNRIKGAEWHFWRGAQPEVIQALQNAGIKAVVH